MFTSWIPLFRPAGPAHQRTVGRILLLSRQCPAGHRSSPALGKTGARGRRPWIPAPSPPEPLDSDSPGMCTAMSLPANPLPSRPGHGRSFRKQTIRIQHASYPLHYRHRYKMAGFLRTPGVPLPDTLHLRLLLQKMFLCFYPPHEKPMEWQIKTRPPLQNYISYRWNPWRARRRSRA